MGKPRIEKNNTTKQWKKVPMQVSSPPGLWLAHS